MEIEKCERCDISEICLSEIPKYSIYLSHILTLSDTEYEQISDIYPLVICYIAMEKMIFNGEIRYEWSCSILDITH